MSTIDLPSVFNPIVFVATHSDVLRLIAIGFLLIALGMTVDEWLRNNNLESRRLSLALGLILALRILQRLMADMLPALLPFIELTSLILLLWAFIRPLFVDRELADQIMMGLLVAALAGELLTGALWPYHPAASPTNGDLEYPPLVLWELVQVGLAGLGVWATFTWRSEPRRIVGAVFGLIGVANGIALFGMPAAIDAINIFVYGLVALAIYRMITSDLRAFAHELRSVSVRSLRQLQEQIFIAEMSRAATGSLEQNSILRVITEYSGLAFDSDHVVVLLFSKEEPNHLYVAARYKALSNTPAESEQTDIFLENAPVLVHALETRQTILLSGMAPASGEREHQHTLAPLLGINQVGPVMIRPLNLKERALGVAIASRNPGRPDFNEEDNQLFSAVAGLVTSALENARLYQELKTAYEDLSRLHTELQTANQGLQALDQLKSAFIGIITHELRSPFVDLDLTLQLLEREGVENLRQSQREQLAQLKQGIGRARRMIDTLVSFASLVSKQGPLRLELVDFSAIVEHEMKALEALARSRQIEIHIQAGSRPLMVQADAARLAEAVYHLLHNAIKFNRPGGRVDIRYWAEDAHLAFEVEDTGAGLRPEQLEQIGQPFFQTADAFRRGIEGLGVGLAAVKIVVEAHGGEMAAQSQEGVGSIFGFRVPLRYK